MPPAEQQLTLCGSLSTLQTRSNIGNEPERLESATKNTWTGTFPQWSWSRLQDCLMMRRRSKSKGWRCYRHEATNLLRLRTGPTRYCNHNAESSRAFECVDV